MSVSVCGVFRHYALHSVMRLLYLSLLKIVIFSCFVENN